MSAKVEWLIFFITGTLSGTIVTINLFNEYKVDPSVLIGQTQAYEQLSKEYGQLAIKYESQKILIQSAEKQWGDLKRKQDEKIAALSKVQATVKSEVTKQDRSDYVFQTPEKTQGYSLNELRINGPDSPPIGYILIKQDGEVVKRNYQFQITVESIQLNEPSGRTRVVSRAFLIADENGLADKRREDLKKWKGEKYPLPVTGGEIVVDPSTTIAAVLPKAFQMLPLNISLGVAISSKSNPQATLDVALAGYGRSKTDLDYKIAQVGVNHSDKYGSALQMTPISVRFWPSMLPNTYVGPGMFLTPEAKGWFLGLNVGL